MSILSALPMYIRRSEYDSILGELKKGNQSFTDTAFAPNNNALGEFSKSPREIVWMRIPDVVEKACIYSLKTHPAEVIISVTSGGSHMKAALTSLALNPEKIHGIFDNQTSVNDCGIYKLRVKINGVLQWMVIDDFIPVFADTKRPLLCGTVNH